MKKFMAIMALIALAAFAAPAFAAENPFTDVPAGHWAYDAVSQLSARGVVSGYPDGAYKGSQPMTRYEMASMVGRALAAVDMDKASKQDMELLKKLVLEFKNELDALGVKVSDLDKRVAVLEDGVGGWKIRGIFQFDANFSDSDGGLYQYGGGKENQFKKERLRFFLTKTIDENTFFYAQYRTGANGGGVSGLGDMDGGRWTDVYVDTRFANDMGLRVGRFAVDFEGDYGLYTDNDAIFGDFRLDGFQVKKSFGDLSATAVVGRNFGAVGHEAGGVAGYTEDHMAYILDLNYRPNEKFMLGATGYWGNEDNDTTGLDSNTYTLYASYGFTPSIALKGMYYWQDNDVPAGFSFDDSPNAWKAALDVKQDVLKFTSLWVEYSQTDNTFLSGAFPRYSIGSTDASVTANRPFNDETTKVWFVKAAQQWNNKWDSWLRFARADFNTAGIDEATEWGLGVGYQYSPAIHFELAYDQVDYGTGTQTFQDKENVFRFRTTVNF